MPHEIQFDSAGHLYIAERDNHVVRKVDGTTGTISTVAGTGSPGLSGDGGPASHAQLRQPHSIALDPTRRFLLICDTGNHRILRVEFATGRIDTFAGTGARQPTPDGAPLQGTPLNGPRTLVFDSAGDLLPCAAGRQRHLPRGCPLAAPSPCGRHRGARVFGRWWRGASGATGRAEGSGVVARCAVLADTENHVIRAIALKTGVIRTVLGTGQRGDGPEPDPHRCALARPHGVLVDSRGVLYVGDSEATVFEPLAHKGTLRGCPFFDNWRHLSQDLRRARISGTSRIAPTDELIARHASWSL